MSEETQKKISINDMIINYNKMIKALEFYGDVDNWCMSSHNVGDRFFNDDLEEVSTDTLVAGKLARETLEEIKKI